MRLANRMRADREPIAVQMASSPNSSVGLLIVNADDWGRDIETTDRILECVSSGAVSSTSAMMFMEDSERAADLARQHKVDCGLHLNFTTPFSAPAMPSQLKEHQGRVIRYLRGSCLTPALYHPGLASSFEYVTAAQMDEFERLFASRPSRVDGHHHMHLCANVLIGRLLPAATMVRRNFSFWPGEKSRINRLYRKMVDRMLSKRHQLTDYFFSLPPLEPASRLDRIFSLARKSIVEVETHPINADEYKFLINGELLRRAGGLTVARDFGGLTLSGASLDRQG